MKSTAHTNSPAIFRKWSALAAVSAALQRKSYVKLNGGTIYPNLFIVLVGGPGIGKSQAINPSRSLISQLTHVALSPARLTPEKFIQLVSKSFKMIPTPDNPYYTQSAYAAFISELSTFIQPNDKALMTVLTDFFDCPKTWTYATLSRDADRIENLYLTLLGAITPKALAENFGTAAFGMGFTSRLNIIFSDEFKAPQLFAPRAKIPLEDLLEDLKLMHSLSGEFTFDDDAAEELQDWVSGGCLPAPGDGRLAEYLPRRWLHLSKLCMVYSACRGSDLRITQTDYRKAKATLLEAEVHLPRALEFLGANTAMEAIRNTHMWLKAEYSVRKAAIPEMQLKRKLLADINPMQLNSTILEMVQSGLMTVQGAGSERSYIPKGQ